MKPAFAAGAATFLTLLLLPMLAFARQLTDVRQLSDWARVSGSLRLGYWSTSRSLDDRKSIPTSALWLKAEPRLGQSVSLTVEGWVRGQDRFHVDDAWGELREAYLTVTLGAMDVRLGKQLIVWGRADRLNPTDNLTPRNFTLLVAEGDDQRLGVPVIKATYYLGSILLTGIWLADFTPDIIPLERVPKPLSLRERSPSAAFRQGAFRVEQTGRAIDWSVSYFDGYDLLPDVAIEHRRSQLIDLVLTHNRIRVFGADAATTVGRYGVRAEAAYTFTADLTGKKALVKNPFLFLVFGVDRTLGEYLNVNVQYFLRVISHFRNPQSLADPLHRTAAVRLAVMTNQRDPVQQGTALRISHKWLNETLEGELVSVLSFPRLDCLFRPQVTYAFTDRWKGTIGAEVFRGSSSSFLGRLHGISAAYVELRWSF